MDLKNYCTGDIVSTKYRLKAMILHSGSIDGGHYTAFGRRNNNVKLLWYYYKWFSFNDERIERINEK